MKIGLVLEQCDPLRGGLERWSCQLAGELVRRGHEVHVVARRFFEAAEVLPIVAHRVQCAGSRRAFAEAAEARLLWLAPDVIHDMGCGWHCDVLQPHSGCLAALAERKLSLMPAWKRPLKRCVDRLLPRKRDLRGLLRRQYRPDGPLLVALSRAVAQDFQRFGGVPVERIRLVPNGIDTDRFSPEHRRDRRRPVRLRLGVCDGTLLALIAAHNFRLKGVPVLLRAVARLVQRRFPMHLVVVGGKRLNAWRRMARQLGIERAVSFVGPQYDMVPFYAAADLYVHPTAYDACSLTVLEAAASGLPVVTTLANGASDLLHDGLDSLLIADPGDADELARQMQRLGDGPLRRAMGAAARQTALGHTHGHNVDEILAVYHEVLERRRSAAGPRGRQKAPSLPLMPAEAGACTVLTARCTEADPTPAETVEPKTPASVPSPSGRGLA